MLALSHDQDASTIYAYLTEIDADSTELTAECQAALLLDADGQLVGIALTLSDDVAPADLALARQHPEAVYDAAAHTLTLHFAHADAPTRHPLESPAILDFDEDERLQGFELLIDQALDIGARLERVSERLIAAEDPPLDVSPNFEVIPEHIARSGFVALVGRPNVGKSTLLNAILGQKVAIVSAKPQTTRTPIRGILTRQDAQLIFVDTPGIHQPRTKLGSFMVDQARRSIPDSDIVCFVVDLNDPPNRLDRKIAEMVSHARKPRLLVLNKIDRPSQDGEANLAAYRELGPWDMEIAVSARTKDGIETLLDELVARLPSGGALYPADQLTDQSERALAAELVREQVLRQTEQEVPHGVAVEVEEWEEKERAVYIRMTIYVEKESQKGILIGAGGARLKQIGSAARVSIERAIGRATYLDLWVKPRTGWRDDPSSLHWLGYTRPKE